MKERQSLFLLSYKGLERKDGIKNEFSKGKRNLSRRWKRILNG